MKAIDLISDLRAGLNLAKEQGQTTVPVVALENYLTHMESAAASATAQAGAKQRDARARFDHEMEVWKIRMPLLFQSTIETGQAALKTAILINGGATVALLAFIGNVVREGRARDAASATRWRSSWAASCSRRSRQGSPICASCSPTSTRERRSPSTSLPS